jgi:hypothetical protein
MHTAIKRHCSQSQVANPNTDQTNAYAREPEGDADCGVWRDCEGELNRLGKYLSW